MPTARDRTLLPSPDTGASVLTVRVYYEDTDAAGVVYYANYLRYCERARTEWLRALGYGQQALRERHGIVFVVRSVEADFRAPARLDDQLEVVSTVLKLGGASLSFSQHIVRGSERIFDARVSIACLDLRANRPHPMPTELRASVRNRLQAAIP